MSQNEPEVNWAVVVIWLLIAAGLVLTWAIVIYAVSLLLRAAF